MDRLNASGKRLEATKQPTLLSCPECERHPSCSPIGLRPTAFGRDGSALEGPSWKIVVRFDSTSFLSFGIRLSS